MQPIGNRKALAAVAVAAAASAVFSHTLGHGFVLDDGPEVTQNQSIRSLAQVPGMFAASAWKGSGEDAPIYRPLTTATYALNYAVGGLSPVGYHLANVLLHALASVLVLALALRLGLPLPAAAFAALLFAVHPVHVEAVANVAGRKDVLAAVLVLTALLAHDAAVRSGGPALLAAPLALAGAMLVKETGVAGIAVLAAWDVLFGREAWRRSRTRAVALYTGYGILLVAYLAARWHVVGSLGVPLDRTGFIENPIAHAPLPVRLMTAIAVLGRGLLLLVAPVTLSPDYSYAAIREVTSPADPAFLASAAAIAAILALVARLRTRSPSLLFAAALFGLTILPGSNLLVPVGTIFGERLLYLPSAGFCLAIGALAARAATTPWARAIPWTGAAVVAALGARTVAYAQVWKDERTLYPAGLRAQPASAKLHQLVGAVLMEQGRPAEALPHFQAVLEITRGTPAVPSRHRLELGYALEQLGRLDEAARVYQELLRSAPAYSDALWRLGVVHWSQGLRTEAVSDWLRTVAMDPGHARALSDLGIASSLAGDERTARTMWERAAAADPRLASVWYRLGASYARDGDHERAREAWREFLLRESGEHPDWRIEVERQLAGTPGER